MSSVIVRFDNHRPFNVQLEARWQKKSEGPKSAPVKFLARSLFKSPTIPFPMNAERPSLRRRIEQLFPRLSLFGRSVTLIAVELSANLIFWVASLMLWIPAGQKGIISLALIAWTLGLRHGLDM